MSSFLLSALISLSGAVEGTFTYQGAYQVHSSVRYETVFTKSTEGQEKLKELKKNGYTCQSKLQFMQCRKSFPNITELPQTLLQATPSVQNVYFGPLIAMDLITQGENIAIFEATQDVLVDGKFYSKAQYLELPDLVKATVGNPHDSSKYHSFVINGPTLSVLDTLTVTESKWAFSNYYVEFTLTP